ncbi:hypothetical protein J437_LFUL003098 [Ladona fulva]|uniref:Deltamethrin resistance protein prag01 domain-containing protein n=1 Tax=Ladona fulva TaxID=123851 RepID=A0A8K0JYT6_LADFU|nr:hypothetical protein J437_LFUL003098 [Ladona fulva]
MRVQCRPIDFASKRNKRKLQQWNCGPISTSICELGQGRLFLRQKTVMMLTRAVQPTLRRVLGASSGARSYHPPADFKEVTYNDMPVPQGSWQAQYDANQRKYNMRLIFGVSFLVGTLIVSKASGLFEFNWAPKMKNK